MKKIKEIKETVDMRLISLMNKRVEGASDLIAVLALSALIIAVVVALKVPLTKTGTDVNTAMSSKILDIF